MMIYAVAVGYLCLWGYTQDRPARPPSTPQQNRTTWDRRIIFLIVAAGIYTMFFVNGYFDPAFFGYVQGHHKFIPNPLDTNESMPITINLESSVFGANSPIKMHVQLNTNLNYRSGHYPNVAPLPENYRVEFTGAYCGVLPPTVYDRIDGCFFDLRKVDPSGIYRGSKELFYSYGGQFDVSLYLPTSNDKDAQHVGEKFIQIDSVASTSTFRTFKAIFVIGIVGSVIGFATWYQAFRRDHWQI
jgi:hypothetical protein